jgi:uncharacterized membrane protein
MESRAKLFGHAIHPMLIPFPLGLLSASVVFDVIYLFRRNDLWAQIAFWNTAGGIIGGLAAAVFGLIDWLSVPTGTRAKAIGLRHGVGNVVVVTLFSASWLLRRREPRRPGTVAIVLGVLGVSLAGVTGWLGGELVERLGVGVDEGAHLNAPSSLSEEPASSRSETPQPEAHS